MTCYHAMSADNRVDRLKGWKQEDHIETSYVELERFKLSVNSLTSFDSRKWLLIGEILYKYWRWKVSLLIRFRLSYYKSIMVMDGVMLHAVNATKIWTPSMVHLFAPSTIKNVVIPSLRHFIKHLQPYSNDMIPCYDSICGGAYLMCVNKNKKKMEKPGAQSKSRSPVHSEAQIRSPPFATRSATHRPACRSEDPTLHPVPIRAQASTTPGSASRPAPLQFLSQQDPRDAPSDPTKSREKQPKTTSFWTIVCNLPWLGINEWNYVSAITNQQHWRCAWAGNGVAVPQRPVLPLLSSSSSSHNVRCVDVVVLTPERRQSHNAASGGGVPPRRRRRLFHLSTGVVQRQCPYRAA
ncbi:hypothetical protein LXL04_012719 [Taraxacum kok-saghyz]